MKQFLAVPDETIAVRILSTVPYKDRFPAGRLRPPVGIIPGTVRSLPELFLLLAPDDSSLPGINLTALVEWIDNVIGDPELAACLRVETDKAKSYVDGCLIAFDLVGERIKQAQLAAGEDISL